MGRVQETAASRMVGGSATPAARRARVAAGRGAERTLIGVPSNWKSSRSLASVSLALVGNTGYRRYLKTISDDHFAIDTDKIEEGKRFDGIFVLRTNTDLNPLDAMLCYKQLWTVEQTFRTAKHLLTTRPIFHKLDETIRGHVFLQLPRASAEDGAGRADCRARARELLAGDHRRSGIR